MRKVIISLALLFAVSARAQDPAFLVSLRAFEMLGPAGDTTPFPTNGLVAYYSMRSSGATVYDGFGTNTATAINSPTFDTAYGVRNDGARFGTAEASPAIGAATYISAAFANYTNITVAAWVNYPGLHVNAGMIFPNYAVSKWEASSSGAFILRIATNRMAQAAFHIGGSARIITGSSVLSTGTWHHMATTYDGSVARLYVNGVQVATSNIVGTLSTTTSPLNIGSRANNANIDFAYRGSIDEVPIYNRAITSNDVQTIYNSGAGRFYP